MNGTNTENRNVLQEDRLSFITPVGYRISSCGYCCEAGSGKGNRKKSSKSYGIWAHNLTPESYQSMLDRGWRRSGQYVYRPDCGNQGTCCAQLAIRLNVKSFKANKEQRRAFNQLQRFVRSSDNNKDDHDRNPIPTFNGFQKGKYARFWDIEREWELIEWQDGQQNDLLNRAEMQNDPTECKKFLSLYHTLRSKDGQRYRKGQKSYIDPPLTPQKKRLHVTLHYAESTQEKYHLFRKYQARVHKETEDEISDCDGFERFLCRSPFLPTMTGKQSCSSPTPGEKVDIHSKNPIHFDLYHMEWRLNDRLIAVGVLDILPRCVSSVYLFYDPDESGLQLGKVSALREIALVRQIQRKDGMASVGHYSMGLYVHSCAKMRYKAKYKPSEILDPEQCVWLKFAEIQKQLDKGVRYGFLNKIFAPIMESTASGKDEILEGSDDDENEIPRPLPPGIEDPTTIPFGKLAQCAILQGGKVYPLTVSMQGKELLPLKTIVTRILTLFLPFSILYHFSHDLMRSNVWIL